MQGDKRRLVTAVLLIACFLMATTWTIKASSGGHYLINWYSMDSGGTMAATGGSFELKGTMGQVDTAVSGQDNYDIQAGFWAGAESGPYQIYLPFIQK